MSGLNETFTKDLVYGGKDGTLDGLIHLVHPAEEAYVVPSPPIRRDDGAMRMVQFAADSVTAATRDQPRFTVANQVPSGGVVFELIIDPEDPDLVDAVGVAKRRYHRYAIIGGSAVFDSLERVRTSTTCSDRPETSFRTTIRTCPNLSVCRPTSSGPMSCGATSRGPRTSARPSERGSMQP